MTAQVIVGQNDEVARKIKAMDGRVVKAIVWLEETSQAQKPDVETILAQLDKDTVAVGDADDSREAIYSRLEDE